MEPTRVLVCGPRGAGKSSLIAAAATEAQPEAVAPVLPPTLLPSHRPGPASLEACMATDAGLPALLAIDTAGDVEPSPGMIAAAQNADAILLCDAGGAGLSRWLSALRSAGVQAPVVVARCRWDDVTPTDTGVTWPAVDAIVDVTADPPSAAAALRAAQRAAVFPSVRLVDRATGRPARSSLPAWRRIFLLCDGDGDGALSPVEVEAYLIAVYGHAAPGPADTAALCRLLATNGGDGGGEEGARSPTATTPALTVDAFVCLQMMMLQRGRPECVWAALSRFGYSPNLRLSSSLVVAAAGPALVAASHAATAAWGDGGRRDGGDDPGAGQGGDPVTTPAPPPPPSPGSIACGAELTPAAWAFLARAYHAAWGDGDGVDGHDGRDAGLSPSSTSHLYATCPGEGPRAVLGDAWATHAYPGLHGFMAQWALAARVWPTATLELLAYLGAPLDRGMAWMKPVRPPGRAASDGGATCRAPPPASLLLAVCTGDPRGAAALTSALTGGGGGHSLCDGCSVCPHPVWAVGPSPTSCTDPPHPAHPLLAVRVYPLGTSLSPRAALTSDLVVVCYDAGKSASLAAAAAVVSSLVGESPALTTSGGGPHTAVVASSGGRRWSSLGIGMGRSATRMAALVVPPPCVLVALSGGGWGDGTGDDDGGNNDAAAVAATAIDICARLGLPPPLEMVVAAGESPADVAMSTLLPALVTIARQPRSHTPESTSSRAARRLRGALRRTGGRLVMCAAAAAAVVALVSLLRSRATAMVASGRCDWLGRIAAAIAPSRHAPGSGGAGRTGSDADRAALAAWGLWLSHAVDKLGGEPRGRVGRSTTPGLGAAVDVCGGELELRVPHIPTPSGRMLAFPAVFALS